MNPRVEMTAPGASPWRIVGLAGAGLGLLAATALIDPAPRLVWNASASVPVGLYWRADKPLRRDALAVLQLPEAVRALADRRGYLPADVPLIKPVAALPGDQICVQDNRIAINGDDVARRLVTDSRGNPMPHWTGCRVLDGEVFVLAADVPDSFDGRYFGPVPVHAITGTLTPLWTR